MCLFFMALLDVGRVLVSRTPFANVTNLKKRFSDNLLINVKILSGL